MGSLCSTVDEWLYGYGWNEHIDGVSIDWGMNWNLLSNSHFEEFGLFYLPIASSWTSSTICICCPYVGIFRDFRSQRESSPVSDLLIVPPAIHCTVISTIKPSPRHTLQYDPYDCLLPMTLWLVSCFFFLSADGDAIMPPMPYFISPICLNAQRGQSQLISPSDWIRIICIRTWCCLDRLLLSGQICHSWHLYLYKQLWLMSYPVQFDVNFKKILEIPASCQLISTTFCPILICIIFNQRILWRVAHSCKYMSERQPIRLFANSNQLEV